jgi:hypothetical protein
VLELARRAAGLGEDRGAVAHLQGVDLRERRIQGVDLHAAQHRAEDLLAVDRHLRRHVAEHRRADPVAVGVALDVQSLPSSRQVAPCALPSRSGQDALARRGDTTGP